MVSLEAQHASNNQTWTQPGVHSYERPIRPLNGPSEKHSMPAKQWLNSMWCAYRLRYALHRRRGDVGGYTQSPVACMIQKEIFCNS